MSIIVGALGEKETQFTGSVSGTYGRVLREDRTQLYIWHINMLDPKGFGFGAELSCSGVVFVLISKTFLKNVL